MRFLLPGIHDLIAIEGVSCFRPLAIRGLIMRVGITHLSWREKGDPIIISAVAEASGVSLPEHAKKAIIYIIRKTSIIRKRSSSLWKSCRWLVTSCSSTSENCKFSLLVSARTSYISCRQAIFFKHRPGKQSRAIVSVMEGFWLC